MSKETKTPEQKKAEAELKAKEAAEKKAAEAAKKAEEKAKKEEEKAKKAVKEVKLPITRDNLCLVASGLFIFSTQSLDEVENEGAFKCVNARNFGVRKGDVVVCKTESEVKLIVVK